MRYLNQISSIIVAFVFVYSLSFKSFITIDYFINQSEIIELFCINKEKPQMQCEGKCHLAKELVATDTDNNDSPFSQNSNEVNLELIFKLEKSNVLASVSTENSNKNHLYMSEPILYREISVPAPPPKG